MCVITYLLTLVVEVGRPGRHEVAPLKGEGRDAHDRHPVCLVGLDVRPPARKGTAQRRAAAGTGSRDREATVSVGCFSHAWSFYRGVEFELRRF